MDLDRLLTSLRLSFSTACYLAFTILILVYHGSHFVIANAGWVVFAVVALLMCVLGCAFQADKLESWGPTKLMLTACVLSSAGYLLFDYRPFATLNVVGLVLLIGGFALYVMLLGKNLACTENVNRLPFLASAVMLCAVLIAISVSLSAWAQPLFVACLPIVASVHMYFVSRMRDDNTFEFMSLEESRNAFKLKPYSLCTTAITGMIWGVAFALLVFAGDVEILPDYPFAITSSFIVIALFLGGAGFMALLATRFKPTESLLLRSFAFFAIAGLAPLPFLPVYAYPFVGACLLFVFTFSNIMCYSAISELARFMQMSPYWVWGISLFWYLLGSTVGFLSIDAALTFGAMPAVSISLVLVVVAGHSFVFEDNYPVEEVDPADLADAINHAEHEPTIWRNKIAKVAEEYDLTARQVEVFRLLVRGRNAQHIAEQFVISNSTAKAHIHNIYQKLDVHSQQELIDLVENADVSE